MAGDMRFTLLSLYLPLILSHVLELLHFSKCVFCVCVCLSLLDDTLHEDGPGLCVSHAALRTMTSTQGTLSKCRLTEWNGMEWNYLNTSSHLLFTAISPGRQRRTQHKVHFTDVTTKFQRVTCTKVHVGTMDLKLSSSKNLSNPLYYTMLSS